MKTTCIVFQVIQFIIIQFQSKFNGMVFMTART